MTIALSYRFRVSNADRQTEEKWLVTEGRESVSEIAYIEMTIVIWRRYSMMKIVESFNHIH